MSAMLTKTICSAIMSIMGLIVVKYISDSKEKLFTLNSCILMAGLIIISAYMHTDRYSYLYTIIIYLMNIIIYKNILNITFIKSTLSCAIMILALILLDSITLVILSLFITMTQLRDVWYFNIISNFIFAIIMILTFKFYPVRKNISSIVTKIENKEIIKLIMAIVIGLITLCTILYTMSINFSINKVFTTNFLLILVFLLFILLLMSERNNYENLSDEYDSLFKYVQIFEDWIEKEQLIRHEYKNQLAVLRNLTREKKVKDKIDSIVDDFINIDNEMITQLKNIPNGGLKGLLYYKISIARKNKISLTVDIEEKASKELSKLSDEKQKILIKLLGIYLDNAIEAAIDTKKKFAAIEIYSVKDNIKYVISNSYNIENDISNRNRKGESTKGEGRGNGLYFASKLISMNNWIKEQQEIINGFYIQNLTITK